MALGNGKGKDRATGGREGRQKERIPLDWVTSINKGPLNQSIKICCAPTMCQDPDPVELSLAMGQALVCHQIQVKGLRKNEALRVCLAPHCLNTQEMLTLVF